MFAFLGFLGYSWLQGSKVEKSVPAEVAVQRFYEHQAKYRARQEGPEAYLDYGARLASALKDGQLASLSQTDKDKLDAELWKMLNDLASDTLSETQWLVYRSVQDNLQSYYDTHPRGSASSR